MSLIVDSALRSHQLARRKKYSKRTPNFSLAHDLIGMACEQKGMHIEAEAEYRNYFDLGANSPPPGCILLLEELRRSRCDTKSAKVSVLKEGWEQRTGATAVI
jgi:hypothetical protein